MGPQNFARGKIFSRKKGIFVHDPKKCFYGPESAKTNLTAHPSYEQWNREAIFSFDQAGGIELWLFAVVNRGFIEAKAI